MGSRRIKGERQKEKDKMKIKEYVNEIRRLNELEQKYPTLNKVMLMNLSSYFTKAANNPILKKMVIVQDTINNLYDYNPSDNIINDLFNEFENAEKALTDLDQAGTAIKQLIKKL